MATYQVHYQVATYSGDFTLHNAKPCHCVFCCSNSELTRAVRKYEAGIYINTPSWVREKARRRRAARARLPHDQKAP